MARTKRNTSPTETSPEPKRPGGKLGDLLTRIESKKGARLDQISATLHWQPHTTRAAITRLRQRGYAIVLKKEGTQRFYKIDRAA